MLPAIDVANWFIDKANEGIDPDGGNNREPGDEISHLKLQKLLYFAQAAHLALREKPLFEEDIYAWEYGPVVPAVYDVFKDHGRNPITSPTNKDYKKIKGDTADLLSDIWRIFGKFSARKLVDITHEHKPWQNANAAKDKKIPQKTIREYYKGVFVEE